jgi:hypothetical protein
MRGLHSITVLATLAAFCAGGCSAASEAFPAGAESSNGGASSGTASPGVGAAVGGGTASSSGSVAALPPETKVESSYQTPVSTRSVVWIANPTSGRVAYINAQTFSVQTVAAGDGPTYLAAVSDPTDDVAIVQNVLSQNITLLRVHPGSLAPPTTTVFPSTADANSWAVSQSGRWAIAWANATQITNPDPTQGFQEIAVIDTTQVRPSTILAVGYRPASIAFSGDSHAYAVTQDGITGIDLLGGTQPSVTQNFPLVAPGESGVDAATGDASGTADAPIPGAIDAAAIDATADAGPSGTVSAVGSPSSGAGGTSVPDVSFTSDGLYALARTDGVLAINIVSLQDGKSTAVVMPALPTDLTVSPDGTFAVAVLRDTSTVAILPLPDIVTDPTSFSTVKIPGQTIGRAIVTAGGKTVLLFETAAAIDALSVLTIQPTPTFFTVALHAPVLAVFPTSDGQNAVVLHNVTPVPGSNVLGAYSLVPIGEQLPALIVSLPAAPLAVALAPAGDRALVAYRDDPSSTFGLDMAMLPSFQVTSYSLASPPTAVGIVTGSLGVDAGAAPAAGADADAGVARGYVGQDYAEGRITFVDLSSGSERTITGFELAAQIVTGSNGDSGP